MTSATFHVRRTIADAIKMKGIMWPFIYIHTPIVHCMYLSLCFFLPSSIPRTSSDILATSVSTVKNSPSLLT